MQIIPSTDGHMLHLFSLSFSLCDISKQLKQQIHLTLRISVNTVSIHVTKGTFCNLFNKLHLQLYTLATRDTFNSTCFVIIILSLSSKCHLRLLLLNGKGSRFTSSHGVSVHTFGQIEHKDGLNFRLSHPQVCFVVGEERIPRNRKKWPGAASTGLRVRPLSLAADAVSPHFSLGCLARSSIHPQLAQFIT